jgi:hypothetical protein
LAEAGIPPTVKAAKAITGIPQIAFGGKVGEEGGEGESGNGEEQRESRGIRRERRGF